MISLGSAFFSLKSNKLRAALTMLGVVIGVSAVISMVSIAEGTNRKIKKEIESMGTNLLLVLPGAQTSSGVRMGSEGITTLVYEDAVSIEGLGSVDSAAPMVRKVSQAVYRNLNWATSVIGTSPSYEAVREWPVSEGRYFTEGEMQSQAKVCLVGNTVRNGIIFDPEPLGKTLRIGKLHFRIIGLLSEKGSTPTGHDQDDIVIVPLSTAQRKLAGISHINSVLVKAKAGMLEDAERDIEMLLRQRHRIHERAENDFTVRNLAEILGRAESASRFMGYMLGAVASVSLIVGGIGIMNIMLVSVAERTKEIGIRRAVGAKRSDIKRQFIIEALVLAGLGGVQGVALGALSVGVVSRLTGLEAVIPAWAVLMSFSFALAVGLLFGVYPAQRAASVEPSASMRYE